MTQQLIQLRAHLHHTRGRLLLDDHITDFLTICLPIGFRDTERTCEGHAMPQRYLSTPAGVHGRLRSAPLHLQRLKHEQRFAHVPVRVPRDLAHDFTVVRDLEALAVRDIVHHFHHLTLSLSQVINNKVPVTLAEEDAPRPQSARQPERGDNDFLWAQ